MRLYQEYIASGRRCRVVTKVLHLDDIINYNMCPYLRRAYVESHEFKFCVYHGHTSSRVVKHSDIYSRESEMYKVPEWCPLSDKE